MVRAHLPKHWSYLQQVPGCIYIFLCRTVWSMRRWQLAAVDGFELRNYSTPLFKLKGEALLGRLSAGRGGPRHDSSCTEERPTGRPSAPPPVGGQINEEPRRRLTLSREVTTPCVSSAAGRQGRWKAPFVARGRRPLRRRSPKHMSPRPPHSSWMRSSRQPSTAQTALTFLMPDPEG